MNDLKQMKQELEETKNKCTEIEKKIEELEKQESEVRWRARIGAVYYLICGDGDINVSWDTRDDIDTKNYELGNYFQTEKEAENVVGKIKIYTQLKDLALRLNNGEKINWSDSTQHKWGIVLDNFENILRCCYACIGQEIGQIYCLDKNFLEIAKQEIGEENLRKLFE